MNLPKEYPKRILNDVQKSSLDKDSQTLLEFGLIGDDMLLNGEAGTVAFLNWLLLKFKKQVAQALLDEHEEYKKIVAEQISPTAN